MKSNLRGNGIVNHTAVPVETAKENPTAPFLISKGVAEALVPFLLIKLKATEFIEHCQDRHEFEGFFNRRRIMIEEYNKLYGDS